MIEQNPFSTAFDPSGDKALIERAIAGNRSALSELMERHQPFIYNVSVKMLGRTEDAKDATQEIVIKVLTNLSRYDPARGQFRTWLYRIAFNYLLKFRRTILEHQIVDYDQFFSFVENVPDAPEAGGEGNPEGMARETMIKCMSGMLMCVPREDRLLYILGDLFRIDHTLGAEIFGVSKANFRKKLSRIRQDLRQWMDDRCGLVNKNNPCRCAKKTKGFIALGIVDPGRREWSSDHLKTIGDYAEANLDDALRSSDALYAKIHRGHPFRQGDNVTEMIAELTADAQFRQLLDF